MKVPSLRDIVLIFRRRKPIVLEPGAGIGNRLKHLASFIRVYGPDCLDIHWPIAGWVDKRFYDLFELEGCRSTRELRWQQTIKGMPLPNAINQDWRLYVSSDDVPIDFPRAYPAAFPAIDFEYERIPKCVQITYTAIFAKFRPSTSVRSRLAQISLPGNTVCVQIRNDEDWKRSGREERLELFVAQLRTYPSDTPLFLSAMNHAISIYMRQRFPNQIIELPNKDYKSMVDAVADMYLLGSRENGVFSYGSTFSEVAWWIGGCQQRVQVVGTRANWIS